MKKLRMIVMAILVAYLLNTAAFAAFEVGKISLNSDLQLPVRGHSFTVSLELNRNPGLSSLRTELVFDETTVELVSVQDHGLLPSFSQERGEDGTVTLYWKAPSGSQDLTQIGVLASLVFRIRDDAPYGDHRIGIDFSDRLFDAQNKSGASLAFDIKAFDFRLICSHLTTETETVTAPTFAASGVGKVICKDCGESRETPLLPQLISADQKTVATVQPGEFTDAGEKSLRTEFLFGGELFEEAKTLFGDRVIRAFQLHFTREGIAYSPLGETTVMLTTEFEQPKNFGFYAVSDGGARKIDAVWKNGILTFPYESGYFVLVEREESPIVSVPEETPPQEEPTVTVPQVSLSPEEQEKEKEIRIIVLGVCLLVVLGIGAGYVLKKGKSL